MGNHFILIVFLLMFAGCGKYGKPLPPEAYSPVAVRNLTASPLADGVQISWLAPQSDLRGKELKSMDGYRIYRQEVIANTAATASAPSMADVGRQFTLITTIEDQHISKLLQLREQALASGKITRTVRVDPALTTFSYTDKGLNDGKAYNYKIVPVNQGGVEGSVRKVVQLAYKGLQSQIDVINADDIMAEEVADQIAADSETSILSSQ